MLGRAQGYYPGILRLSIKADAMVQKQQEKEAAKQARAETRARKRASRKENQETSADLSAPAIGDLSEASQAPARLATTSQVPKSAYGSLPKVKQATRGANKPMLVVETDSEFLQAESPGRRPKHNTRLPGRFEDFELG